MELVQILVMGFGFLLAAIGLMFAYGGKGSDPAGGSATKQFSVSGPAWLILTVVGVALFFVGAIYEWEPVDPENPPAVDNEDEDDHEDADDDGDAPYDYGDDQLLDTLWDFCSLGDWDACDELWFESESDSEYEYFAGTCGYFSSEYREAECYVFWE